MKSSMTLVRVALAFVGVIALGSEPGAKAPSEQTHKGLEGTWRVTVTPYNCSTRMPLGVPFHALLAFAAGGTLSGASSNSGFQPGQVQRFIRYLETDGPAHLRSCDGCVHSLQWRSVPCRHTGNPSLDSSFGGRQTVHRRRLGQLFRR